MFRMISHPVPAPFGSCVLTLRSPVGTDLHLLAWLAADVSLLKDALVGFFHCSADDMSFLSPSLVPLPDRTWIRHLPVMGPSRLIYLAILDRGACAPIPLHGDTSHASQGSQPLRACFAQTHTPLHGDTSHASQTHTPLHRSMTKEVRFDLPLETECVDE